MFCVAYIELVRGVPLITVLFMASVMLPLFLPTGMTIDKLLRAQVGVHPVRRRLSRRGRPRRPAGDPERPDRGGGCAGARLLAAHPADRPAAGPVAGDPAAGQQLHRRLQGHLAGHHHRPVRPARHRQRGAGRPELAAASRPRPMSSPRRSISASASSCRATARCWSANSTRAGGDDRQDRRGGVADHRVAPRPQMVRRLPRAQGHQPRGRQGRAGRRLRARRAPANRR